MRVMLVKRLQSAGMAASKTMQGSPSDVSIVPLVVNASMVYDGEMHWVRGADKNSLLPATFAMPQSQAVVLGSL